MSDEQEQVKIMNGRNQINNGRKTSQLLKPRTKAFALGIINLYGSLPKKPVTQIIGSQILRSGTSVGANYREAIRSRSSAEFISKIEISTQELEETIYWLELLVESGSIPENLVKELTDEANELMAMLTASAKTAKGFR